jgi:hypothetical protein
LHFLLAVEKAVLGANGGPNARADTRKACLLLAPFRTPTGCLTALPKAQPKIGADLTRNLAIFFIGNMLRKNTFHSYLAEEAVISEPVSVGSLFHGKIQGNSQISGLR